MVHWRKERENERERDRGRMVDGWRERGVGVVVVRFTSCKVVTCDLVGWELVTNGILG